MLKRAAGLMALGVLLSVSPTIAQSTAKARATTPEIPYDVVPNFFKLPQGLYLGEALGVATNSKGHIFVYTRSGETRLFEFDRSGNYVREIGQGLYGFSFAHSVRVDSQDNIWAVDEGTNMIIKFNPEGHVIMVLGRRPDPVLQLAGMPGTGAFTGANKPYSFSRETDIAWDPAGNIFVSDGYDDARVVKLDKSGRFIKSVGTRGSAPLQFNTPHSIAVDAAGLVYVGDRGNARVQVLDNDLNLKAIYDTVGNPWAVCVSGGPHQYLFVSNSWPDGADSRNAATTGEVYKMELDGTILGRFGKAGKSTKEISTLHEMDCRNPDEIYSAEINNWRAQKIVLRPQPSKLITQRH